MGAYESVYVSQKPRAGSIADGLTQDGDRAWSNSTASMSANWWGFTDNDVLNYEYAVGDIVLVSESEDTYLSENFNGPVATIPDGWTLDWWTESSGESRMFYVEQSGGVNNSKYVRVNVWVNGDMANLITPEVGPVNAGDSLFFYYRAIEYGDTGPVELNSGDEMNVYYQDSNTSAKTRLWGINSDYSPTSEWQEVRIIMPSFSDQYGSFVFEAVDGQGGNDWYACFDEIIVKTLTNVYGINNMLSWTSSGSDTSVVISGLTLEDGETYSVSVRAIDTDLQVSDTVYTDGVVIDAASPVVYDVKEGYITEPEAQNTYSLSFDGMDDFIEIPYSPELNMSDGLTIAAWIYPTIHEGESTILMKGQYGYGFALTWNGESNCSPNNAQNLVYWDQSGCWDAIYSTITYEFDQWQHMAVTVQDIGNQLQIYFYVNGVQDGPHYSNQPSISNGDGNEFSSLRIGDQGGQGSNPFYGKIADLAIWGGPWMEDQINILASEYEPSLTFGLRAHWNFSEGAGSVITDQSGNGNNGNVFGSVWSLDIPAPPFEGEIIDIDFQNNTSELQAFWSGSDDASGLNNYEHSVGTTPGDTDASGWADAGISTSDIISGLDLSDGQNYYLNVRAWDVAGNVSSVVSSDGVVIDLSPPVGTIINDGTSDDVSYTLSTSTLSANWSAFTEAATSIAKYEVSFGNEPGGTIILDWKDNGTETEYTLSGLSLTSGTTYFANVRATDLAGNISDPVSSNGVTVDTDGPENIFVFDGLVDEDLDWLSENTTISAHWYFVDVLSGLPSFNAYSYAIGTTPGGTQYLNWTTVPRDTFFTLSGQGLVGGTTYYIALRATDILGNQSTAVSDGVTIDMEMPTVGVPLDGSPEEDIDWQSSTNSISIYWTANDTRDRQLDYFEYAVSTTPGDSDMVAWTGSNSNNSATITGLNLSEETTYYGSVRAYDAAGNRSSTVTSDGITIDATVPVSGSVTDGFGDDISFTPSNDLIEGHWSGFSDALSGVAYYRAAVGTSPGSANAASWQDFGLDTQATFTGLSLSSGQTYYLSVRAYDEAHNESEPASSDGVVSDQDGPVPGQVVDGISEDVVWVISPNELEASWNNFQDHLSGIHHYEYAVGTSSGGTNVLGWTYAEMETEMPIQGLSLSHSSQYYISVRGIDNVNNIGEPSSSNGLTVDLVLPVITDVIESENDTLDMDYMNQADTIIVSWSGEDGLSGIDYFETSLGTSAGDDDAVAWTEIDNPNVFSNELQGLGLENGTTYFASVRAIDIAGNLSDVLSGDGVLIDLTSPVNGNVLDGAGEDQAFTSSSDTLLASWSGFIDDISGIEYFEYAIGMSENGTETLNWKTVGPDTVSFLEDGLPLENAQIYYSSVRATDFAGNVSTVSVSNGITIDLTDLGLLTSSLSSESYLPIDGIPLLEYTFSEGLNSGSVEIAGNLSGSISSTILDSAVSIEFIGPFASLDTFNIVTTVDDYSGKDSMLLDYTFYTETLADYNQDLVVDVQDLTEFVTAWNSADLTKEIGPVTGVIPQVTTALDGILDLRDIMAFTRMWHWSHSTPIMLASRVQDGPELIVSQDGNKIIITIPSEAQAVQAVVEYPATSKDILVPADIQDQQEIQLSKKEKENGIVLVEKAFLQNQMEKKLVLETRSFDQNPAGIEIHYISYGPDGNNISSGVKKLDIVAIPHEFALRQNYPNPFNPITHIRYEAPENGPIQIIIYDILGKEVASILNTDIQAGYHSIAWRGQNKRGQPVGAGVYFVQMRSKRFTKTIKMLLLK